MKVNQRTDKRQRKDNGQGQKPNEQRRERNGHGRKPNGQGQEPGGPGGQGSEGAQRRTGEQQGTTALLSHVNSAGSKVSVN